MLNNSLTIMPYNNNKSPHYVSFAGGPRIPRFKNPIPTPKELKPYGSFTNVPLDFVNDIETKAHIAGMSTAEYLMKLAKFVPKTAKVAAVGSKTVKVGNVKISTHIDGDQYFKKAFEFLDSAKKSIQVEMFEFQNLSVDGDKWATCGAETLSGSKLQQRLLWTLIKKKKENPDMKIQVILDAHKWYIDSFGKKRHYGNQDMIKFLKRNNIDVVPYPRASQQGSALQHIKLLIVDGKKAILGGMNWGSHSAANHDACVALETIDGKTSSEVDNLVNQHFNQDWKFSWQRLGETELVPGPLNQEEQKFFNGLDKEIKQENVEYYRLLKEFFDTPGAKNRYKENRLDLIESNPLAKPAIKVLGTKPRELEEVGEKGIETSRDYLMDKIKTCKKLRAELFVLTDKELVKNVIKRVKSGELDAQFIVEADIKEKFPYCENAFDELVENGIQVRVYKSDKTTRQRMHSKWAVFDDKEVMIGSTNWSAQGLNQNLGKGMRGDYPLTTSEIDDRILDSLEKVKEHEDKLKIPELIWDGARKDYKDLKARLSILRKAYTELKSKGKAAFTLGDRYFVFYKDEHAVRVNNKKFMFGKDDEKGILAELRTIMGYYNTVKRRHLSKEKFKRGNNELAIAFESPDLAKNVFTKQFGLDWAFSESKFDSIKNKVIPIKKPGIDIEG